TVKTRILILSDTHGRKPHYTPQGLNGDTDRPLTSGFRFPLPEADVAIHCGDLTSNSNLQEFEATFSMLRDLSAPLKLVIAGNHDVALDRQHWDPMVKKTDTLPAPLVERYKRCPDEVQRVVDAARQDGVIYLPSDGVYDFDLANGAHLRVFASPMTPEYGSWAFQYPRGGHKFDIPAGIDVVVSHGPPRNVLDNTIHAGNAGCDDLFAAVCASRPKIHCFGHIHEGWGAELVTWKPPSSSPPVQKVAQATIARFYEDKCVPVDVTVAGALPLRPGEQTLFINAAIMDVRYRPRNVPWLVDIDLP
ncbi:hypothetical protein ACRALDRAFT_2072745, partial [Sodiomyces alcalophilus JCM 7366]|uniref:uncharacterized protein n=1 Tax=Sodiomyces alcalophilus JCM 7366 TaxID=591952 RepID=UPI0039B59658